MSTSAAASSSKVDDSAVIPDDVRSDNDRKRKAETQGCRNDDETETTEISEEETEERSIKQLVWEDLWSHDHGTVAKATSKLFVLADKDHPDFESNCKQIFEMAGHVVLLKNVENSLNRNDRHRFIEEAVGILTYLSCSHAIDISKTPNIINCVVKVMRSFADYTGCWSWACGLVGNLSRFNDNVDAELYEAGGIPLVIENMKRFPNSEVVQEYGSYLLHMLFRSTKKRKKIFDAAKAAKALSVLAQAKENFTDNDDIQKRTKYCVNILNSN